VAPFLRRPPSSARQLRPVRQSRVVIFTVALALTATGLYASSLAEPVGVLAATGSAGLMPAAGQFFSVAPVKVMDTRDGAGGVPSAPLGAGGTVSFPVIGAGQVPPGGVSDVYVVISAISPAGAGCLHDYSSDIADPGICTASFQAGQNVTVSDIVQVSSAGKVSVTNASSGTTDVSVTVLGYYQDASGQAAGETYVPLTQADIVDTRSGLGAPKVQIPAGGSLTVQVSGNGGIPSDAAGAALFIGAANASQAGYVSAYPAGGTPSSLSIISYSPNRTIHDLYFGALSSTGQLTLVNRGPVPADLMVGVQGYLVSPAAGEAGNGYQDVPESRIVDTRYGTGGVPGTPVPAGGSITFTATGVDSVPAAGVPSVAESVAALDATGNGYLSAYPAGTADPQQPGVNFNAGDGQDNDMSAPLLSSVSPAGQETITNHSSGTVDVVVSVRGYYIPPSPPSAPDSVSATTSGQSATITWSPPGADGGSAVMSYTITAAPDNAQATVAGGTDQVTLTGLAHASADTFTVTASNAVGTSDSGAFSPPGVITGTVVSPSGQPVAGASVSIYSSDVPTSDPASWTPSVIGTVTTDANGIWSLAVPSYSALPADAQAAADSNGGWLNLDASAAAYATVGATTYNEGADAGRSAWVGTSAQPSGPVKVATSDTGLPVMTVTPDQADLSYLDTDAAENSMPGYQNSPTLTDSNNAIIGNPANAYLTPPTDSYGYQSIAGPDNNYNPYQAADGTDLSTVPVTGSSNSGCGSFHPGDVYRRFDYQIWKKHRYTIIGEYHVNWDGTGGLSYDQGATSSIGVDVSADGYHFHFGFYITYNHSDGSETGPSGAGRGRERGQAARDGGTGLHPVGRGVAIRC